MQHSKAQQQQQGQPSRAPSHVQSQHPNALQGGGPEDSGRGEGASRKLRCRAMAEGSWSCFLVPGHREGRHQRALTPLPGQVRRLGRAGDIGQHLRYRAAPAAACGGRSRGRSRGGAGGGAAPLSTRTRPSRHGHAPGDTVTPLWTWPRSSGTATPLVTPFPHAQGLCNTRGPRGCQVGTETGTGIRIGPPGIKPGVDRAGDRSTGISRFPRTRVGRGSASPGPWGRSGPGIRREARELRPVSLSQQPRCSGPC